MERDRAELKRGAVLLIHIVPISVSPLSRRLRPPTRSVSAESSASRRYGTRIEEHREIASVQSFERSSAWTLERSFGLNWMNAL